MNLKVLMQLWGLRKYAHIIDPILKNFYVRYAIEVGPIVFKTWETLKTSTSAVERRKAMDKVADLNYSYLPQRLGKTATVQEWRDHVSYWEQLFTLLLQFRQSRDKALYEKLFDSVRVLALNTYDLLN